MNTILEALRLLKESEYSENDLGDTFECLEAFPLNVTDAYGNKKTYYIFQTNIKRDEDEEFISCDYEFGYKKDRIGKYTTFDKFPLAKDSNEDLLSIPATQIKSSSIWKAFEKAINDKTNYDNEQRKLAQKKQQEWIAELEKEDEYKKSIANKASWEEDSWNAHTDIRNFTREGGTYIHITPSGKEVEKEAHCHTAFNLGDARRVLRNREWTKPFYVFTDNGHPQTAKEKWKKLCFEFAETPCSSFSKAKSDTVYCRVGGKYEGQYVDYKYRPTIYATPQWLKQEGLQDWEIRMFTDFKCHNDIVYDLVIYKHRNDQSDPYEIVTSFPATSRDIARIGGRDFNPEADSIAVDSNIETYHNKLMIYDKESDHYYICPITEIHYGSVDRKDRGQGVDTNFTLNADVCGRKVSTGQKINSNGNKIINTTNKSAQELDDARDHMKTEILRTFIEWKKSNKEYKDIIARTAEIGKYANNAVWISDIGEGFQYITDHVYLQDDIDRYYAQLKQQFNKFEVKPKIFGTRPFKSIA